MQKAIETDDLDGAFIVEFVFLGYEMTRVFDPTPLKKDEEVKKETQLPQLKKLKTQVKGQMI